MNWAKSYLKEHLWRETHEAQIAVESQVLHADLLAFPRLVHLEEYLRSIRLRSFALKAALDCNAEGVTALYRIKMSEYPAI